MTKQQIEVCAVLSRHFKVGKSKTRAEVTKYLEGAGGGAFFEVTLGGITFNVAVSNYTLSVKDMFYPEKLEEIDFYSDLINMFHNYSPDFVGFLSGSAVMIARQTELYDGSVGMFIRFKARELGGVVIEPLKTYLIDTYPPEEI
jgi:hypothetical protein